MDDTKDAIDEEIAELKKVWSLIDTDGSGHIDASELKGLMAKLIGAEPKAEEVARILEKIDSNHDGSITWEEFEQAMIAWMGLTAGTKKRNRDEPGSPVHRRRVHRVVAQFFTQFRKREGVDELRRQISADLEDNDDEIVGLDPAKSLTAEEKATRVANCTEGVKLVPTIQASLGTKDAAQIISAVDRAHYLLGIVEEFNTPVLKFEISELLLSIFHAIASWNIPQMLIEFITPEFSLGTSAEALVLRNNLQLKIMQVLRWFIDGPRIPYCPAESPWHLSAVWRVTKQPLIERRIVQALHAHLSANADDRLRAAAAELLASIASDHEDCWVFVMCQKVMATCLQRLASGDTPMVCASILKCMSVLVGETRDRPVTLEMFNSEQMQGEQVLQACSGTMQRTDMLADAAWPLIVANCCRILSHLLPWMETNPTIVQLVLKVPTETALWNAGPTGTAAIQAALDCLRELMMFDERFAGWLVDSAKPSVLTMIQTFLSKVDNKAIRLTACRLLDVIVRSKCDQTAVVATEGLLPAVITLVQTDEALQARAVKILLAWAGAGPRVVIEIATKNGVAALLKCLGQFRKHDSMLAEIYQFAGPTFNVALVSNALRALHTILSTGALHKTATNGRNPLLKFFGMDAVEACQGLLIVLSEERGRALLSAIAATEGNVAVEDMVVAFVAKMREEHAEMAASAAVSAEIVASIDRLGAQWAAAKQAFVQRIDQERKMDIDSDNMFQAAFHGAYSRNDWVDVVVTARTTGDLHRLAGTLSIAQQFPAPRSCTFQQLRQECSRLFGRPVELQFERSDGVIVNITSQLALDEAFAEQERARRRELRLYAFDASQAGTSFGTVPYLTSADGLPPKKVALNALRQSGINMDWTRMESIYDFFAKHRNSQGITKDEFIRNLRELGVRRNHAEMDAIFTAFDVDGNGLISYEECVVGLSVFQSGSRDERLRMAFKAFDTNGDDELDENELFKLFKTVSHVSDKEAWDNVTRMLRECDENGDGVLTFAEFSRASASNDILNSMFWTAA